MTDEAEVEPLAFDNRQSNSYKRVETAGVVLTPRGRFAWVVHLFDAVDEHYVELYRDNGHLVGRCDCRGFEYHPGPCAHLWAVRRASECGPAATIADVEDGFDGIGQCPVCGEPRPLDTDGGTNVS